MGEEVDTVWHVGCSAEKNPSTSVAVVALVLAGFVRRWVSFGCLVAFAHLGPQVFGLCRLFVPTGLCVPRVPPVSMPVPCSSNPVCVVPRPPAAANTTFLFNFRN